MYQYFFIKKSGDGGQVVLSFTLVRPCHMLRVQIQDWAKFTQPLIPSDKLKGQANFRIKKIYTQSA